MPSPSGGTAEHRPHPFLFFDFGSTISGEKWDPILEKLLNVPPFA